MKRKTTERVRSALVVAALPALKRARRRAEEIARDTSTALVFANGGRPVLVRPRASERSGKTAVR